LPHHKSAKKRLLTSRQRNLSNRTKRAQMRTAIKAYRQEAANLTPEEKGQRLSVLYRLLDVQARKGIIHKKKAARLKSRLVAVASK
jgi:small subunit ribosomal protein S20